MSVLRIFFLALAMTLPGRLLLADEGKDVFIKNKCTQCHDVVAGGIGLNAAAPVRDLSKVGSIHSEAWLHLYLQKKETLKGKKHKKRFKGGKEERQILIKWLLSLKQN